MLLVLPIIFMVSSPLKQREHPIRVPQPAPPDMPQPDSIIVEMDANQTTRPNQHPFRLTNCGRRCLQSRAAEQTKNMHIRRDSGLPYGVVFEIWIA